MPGTAQGLGDSGGCDGGPSADQCGNGGYAHGALSFLVAREGCLPRVCTEIFIIGKAPLQLGYGLLPHDPFPFS